MYWGVTGVRGISALMLRFSGIMRCGVRVVGRGLQSRAGIMKNNGVSGDQAERPQVMKTFKEELLEGWVEVRLGVTVPDNAQWAYIAVQMC